MLPFRTPRGTSAKDVARAARRPDYIEALEPRLLYALPPGFAQTQWVAGLSEPTAMAMLPDGRVLVCEQGGALRVVSPSGQLLSTPFATVPARNVEEQGLIGVCVDPNFASNGYVYLSWGTLARNGRVSRFTADASNPNVAAAGSQVDLIDLPYNGGNNHQGGAIHFGNDGKLYFSVGEHGEPSYAQTLANPFGKMLRFNPDGSIPTDNPFYNQATGINRAIWAMGLRNPFTFAVQKSTGRMMISDVGEKTWEEVDVGRAGANYGWPTTEGPFNAAGNPQFTNPAYAYSHNDEPATSVMSGLFYEPAATATNPWPAQYRGKYIFSDYTGQFVRVLDPDNGYARTDFAGYDQLPNEVVSLDLGADGSVYALSRSGGVITKISYTGSNAPSISTQPQSRTVTEGGGVTFSVSATGAAPLSYQWQRNGANIAGATSASYTLASTTAADSGARFRCVVSNASGSATSNEATLTVTANRQPVPTITAPADTLLYRGGQVIDFAGTATDPEDGALPAGAYTWRIDFHHDTHFHPFMPDTAGITGGSFTTPTGGETSANVWFRIHLTVHDSGGLTSEVVRDVHPQTADVTLATNVPGLSLNLDGAPHPAPYGFTGVVGVTRDLAAPATQTVDGVTYEFVSWSDGGAADHDVPTPDADTTYTANYRRVDAAPVATPLEIPDVSAAGGGYEYFKIGYGDDVSVDYRTIDGNDVVVTGPNGFSQNAFLANLPFSGDPTKWCATYRITAPGGTWDRADAGTYTVSVRPAQVADGAGQYVAAGVVGQFTVSVPDTAAPTATLGASDVTSGGGSYYWFSVTYADDTAVNLATVNGGDVTVLAPDGTAQRAFLSNLPYSSNGTPRTATYRIGAPGGAWDPADNGGYSVQLNAGEIADTAGNFAAAANLGGFTVNVSATASAARTAAITAAPAPAKSASATDTTAPAVDLRSTQKSLLA